MNMYLKEESVLTGKIMEAEEPGGVTTATLQLILLPEIYGLFRNMLIRELLLQIMIRSMEYGGLKFLFLLLIQMLPCQI